MKKPVLFLCALLLFPAVTSAQSPQLLERFGIAGVHCLECSREGAVLFKTLQISMSDGTEFVVPTVIDTVNRTVVAACASGDMVVYGPNGSAALLRAPAGERGFDDIDNSVRLVESYSTEACLLNVLGWLVMPYPLDLVFLYFAVLTCL